MTTPSPRLTLLRQLRALDYEVTLQTDMRFFYIFQDGIAHSLSYPEAKQLAEQPEHPVKLDNHAKTIGAVTLYLFPEKQPALLHA